MKTTEIRVRPVVRYTVTRFTSDPENGAGGCELLAEFDHESYADQVAAALKEQTAEREYVIVESTMGEIMARVTYAYSEQETLQRLAIEAVDGKTYQVYSRIKS